MKGVLIALVILTLILAAVTANAFYIRGVTQSLMDRLDALPPEPSPAELPGTAEAISAIRRDFEEQIPLLGATVLHSTLDRITESLSLLETQARTANLSAYSTTLPLLRHLIQEIARLEQVGVENLL